MGTSFVLFGIGGFMVFLAIGGFVADCVIPRIHAVERFLDKFENQ